MRIILLSLFSFIAVFGFSNKVFAQNNSSGVFIDLNGENAIREKVYPNSKQTGLQICGLQEGQEYAIYLGAEGDNIGISTSANGVFQRTITFTAQNECQALGLKTNYSSNESQEVPVISVECTTCEEKEISTVKSMMGVTGSPNLDGGYLVRDVFIGGDCFETSGATTTGSPLSIGTFTGGLPVFGFDEGILLSTGFVANTQGPSTVFNSDNSNGPSGDGDLSTLTSSSINDVAILEFDFYHWKCQHRRGICWYSCKY